MLRRKGIAEVQGLVHVRSQENSAVLQALPDDIATGCCRRLDIQLLHDCAGHEIVGCDQHGYGAGIVLPLGDHIRRDHTGIGGPVRQDEDLAGTGGKVDLHAAPQKHLGRGDIDIARSHKNPVEIKLQGIALGTALFSAMSMYALSQYKARVGRQIDSQALIADALHSYTDVFSSLIVVIAIAGSILGIMWLDSVGVLLISLMIFKLGIGIARDSVLTLMDAWLDRDSITRTRQNVASIQGVKQVEEIRLRKSGLVVFGEIEIEIEGNADLKRVEMLSEEIEKTVKNEVKNLEHLVINAKPGKMSAMKIAVPVLEPEGLQSKVSRHFGRAPYFIIFELEGDEIKSWQVNRNPASGLERKRGLKTAEFLKSQGVNVVIVGEIGEGPFHNLHDSFVKMLRMPEEVEDVEKVVEKVSGLSRLTSHTE